jgi:hypothetical protein
MVVAKNGASPPGSTPSTSLAVATRLTAARMPNRPSHRGIGTNQRMIPIDRATVEADGGFLLEQPGQRHGRRVPEAGGPFDRLPEHHQGDEEEASLGEAGESGQTARAG